jgi:hypothetical protein
MSKKGRKIAKSSNLFFKITPSIIFAAAGLFYLVLPHQLHVALGLDFAASHSDHIVFGIVLLIFSGIIWYINREKTK